jgi:UDP-2,3-diacylglucosamine pyrophosphatase LpxH
MSDIRYICLSDLHLGAENNLLTKLVAMPHHRAKSEADPQQANEVMIQLVKCLRELISKNVGQKKPTLILNGDALELALADVNQSAMVFERFMELTMKPGEELFDGTIYYNPGNHDHHLWETARETQYVENYLSGTKWGDDLKAPWHTTNMLLEQYDAVPCYLLNRLVARMPQSIESQLPQFLIVYPNFAVHSSDRQKCVIFSHGHYIESLYRLMTTLRTIFFPHRKVPEKIWEVESENFAWIDFFWSTLGRSGDVGADMELIYDKLQSDAALKKLMANLAKAFAKNHRIFFLPQLLEQLALEPALNYLADRVATREVKETGTPLSLDAEAGLKLFLEKYLLSQIKTDNNQQVPSDVTFIFGHTHKPFEQARHYHGYTDKVKFFNSGGWVVDSMQPTPIHGGAVILVDDDLNTASLRMYNEAESDSQLPPTPFISEVIDNSLVQRLKPLVTKMAPWNSFTEAVFAEIPLQRKNLSQKIDG